MILLLNAEVKRSFKSFILKSGYKRFVQLALMIILTAFISCKEKKTVISSEFFLSQDLYTFEDGENRNTERLPVSANKLRQLLGNDIIPVGFKVFNSKSSQYEEMVFCYQENKDSDVKVIVFSILPNEVLRKLYEYNTAIFHKTDFSIQITNLFYEDDSYILIEGLDRQNRKNLYIFSNNPGQNIQLLTNFNAAYSLFYDFIEKEYESSKFFVLKEIVLLNNALSATNTIIQKRDVYVWNYNTKSFVLSESSQIISEEISDIPSNVLYSRERYFDFIEGFWYSEAYKRMIDTDKIMPEDFERNSIRYAYFNHQDEEVREIHINYGDYTDIYIIDKIINLGGTKPGLRFTLKDHASLNTIDFRYVDIYLMDSKRIRIKGPEDYDFEGFVRLPKPFIEYLDEARKSQDDKILNSVKKTLNGTFSNSEFLIEFTGSKFTLISNDITETGSFTFIQNNSDSIIFMQYDEENRILNDTYFIVQNMNNERIVLIPVRPGLNGYTILNSRPVTLTRKS